jgi:hypothetical protein
MRNFIKSWNNDGDKFSYFRTVSKEQGQQKSGGIIFVSPQTRNVKQHTSEVTLN